MTFKRGDRVRVVFKGEISSGPSAPGEVLVRCGYYSAFVPESACELLPKPLKVGDVIPAGCRPRTDLPWGAVVLTDCGIAWTRSSNNDGWASHFRRDGLTDARFFDPSFHVSDLTVAYLPEK